MSTPALYIYLAPYKRLLKTALLLFCLLCGMAGATAQQPAGMGALINQAHVEQLYQQCLPAREDTVNRICMGFLNSHHLRKNPAAFYAFCLAFKTYCQQQGNGAFYRRMAIIELHGRLRFDSAGAQQANQAFEALFDSYAHKGDHGAALECLFELGQFLHRVKDNIGAIQVLFYAEKFAARHNLQQQISYHGILHKTGYILWELDKPLRSIDYFKKALETGNGITMDSMVALNGIGINYQKLDSLQASMHYFTAARQVALHAGNEVFATIVMGSAAATLEKMDRPDTAYHYYRLYKDLSFKDTLWSNAAEALYRMVQLEVKRNNIIHARILLDSFDRMMTHIPAADFVSLKRHKEAAYHYYHQVRDYRSALYAYKDYVHFDSLFQDYANKNRISELDLNAAIRLYDQEMARKEQARRWRVIITYIVAAVLAVALCVLALYGYRKIRRAEQDKQAAETHSRSQAVEIETLREQLLAQLAAMRNYNISVQAMAVQEEQTANTEEANATVAASNDDDGQPSNGHILLNEYNLAQKEQWKDFKESFARIYPGFEQQLAARMGPVSGAELRLMMLHKLGLSNKEIAQTLLISADGVKKGKYRLYKKLGVSSAEELSAFLEQIV